MPADPETTHTFTTREAGEGVWTAQEQRQRERRERLYDRWEKIRRKSELAIERMIKRFWRDYA